MNLTVVDFKATEEKQYDGFKIVPGDKNNIYKYSDNEVYKKCGIISDVFDGRWVNMIFITSDQNYSVVTTDDMFKIKEIISEIFTINSYEFSNSLILTDIDCKGMDKVFVEYLGFMDINGIMVQRNNLVANHYILKNEEQ